MEEELKNEGYLFLTGNTLCYVCLYYFLCFH